MKKIAFAFALLLMLPFPAMALDEAETCKILTELSDDTNSKVPYNVDPLTRMEEAILSCSDKILEFKKSVRAAKSQGKAGWETQMKKDWNATFCPNPALKELIKNGWKIIQTLQFSDSKSHSVTVDCE